MFREEEELVVSTPYIEHWNDLIDLWYLGMQVCLKSSICNFVQMYLRTRVTRKNKIYCVLNVCSLYYNESN